MGFNPQREGYKRRDVTEEERMYVSIPKGKATNIEFIEYCNTNSGVSIPKGKATNILLCLQCMGKSKRFQSPKGRLQTYDV